MWTPISRRSWTPELHIAYWRDRYEQGLCSLETFEWVVAETLREADEHGPWPSRAAF
jgi:hypothetical protein